MRNGGLRVEFVPTMQMLALESSLNPKEVTDAEAVVRQGLVTLFGARLRQREKQGKGAESAAIATFDMLQVALDTFGTLSCWMLAHDTKTTDKDAAQILALNVMDVVKVAITNRIGALRRLGREVSFGEEP